MKHKLTEKQYAEREKCSVRTIRNWKRDGAPLDDPERLIAWKAGRQHLPNAREQEQRASDVVNLPPLKSKLPRGAASALARLEEMETATFEALQTALASNDHVAIRLARKNWLETGEYLRRYELVVEQSRRDCGELLPRSACEEVLRNFGLLATLAYRQNSQSILNRILAAGGDVGEVCNALESICANRWLATVAAISDPSIPAMRLPEWAKTAFQASVETCFGKETLAWLHRLAEVLKSAEEAANQVEKAEA